MKDFDFICLSETKIQYIDSPLTDYSMICKENNLQSSSRLGGHHGLCIIFKHWLRNYVEQLDVNVFKSESVLWVKVNKGAYGFDFIIGAIYMPHENSKYYDDDLFEDITYDLMRIKGTLKLPVCLIGDFNARTGLLKDYIENDDSAFSSHGISSEENADISSTCTIPFRFNEDKIVNANGRKLIDLCQTTDMHIVNGRFGKDFGKGALTCANASTVDYCIVSTDFIDHIEDFIVDDFEKCLSDKHSPISVSMKYAKKRIFSIEKHHYSNNDYDSHLKKKYFKWNSELTHTFSNSLNENEINKIVEMIEVVRNKPQISSQSVNDIVNEVKQVYFKSATLCGMSWQKKTGTTIATASSKMKPWFDKECMNLRKKFLNLRNKIKKCKDEKTKMDMESVLKTLRKQYNTVLDEKRSKYVSDLQDNLRKVKNNNTGDFWKYLNKANFKPNHCANVSIDAFKDFFELLNKGVDFENKCTVDEKSPPSEANCASLELNYQILEEEVENQLKKLKNNKSSGDDLVLNEMLKYSNKPMIKLLTKLFNLILDCGKVPLDWTVGILCPIYKKKGSVKDPDNYRPITLLSCLGKLFTSILNNRISYYFDICNLMGEEQAGFREDYCTLDHTFTLYCLIDIYLSQKKRIYCAFIDYKKAFDSIKRNLLWSKMLKYNINGKMLRVIQNMYENAKSYVRSNGQQSELFECNIGVRQGDNLSPLLFAIFINDFENTLRENCNGVNLLTSDLKEKLLKENICVYLKLFTLLYADDTIVLAESENDLQEALNVVHKYCKDWSLNVNIQKTKIVVFSRGKIRNKPIITFNNQQIEVVDDYTYLGTVLNYNNRFSKARQKQISQAQKALFSLRSKSLQLSLPVDIELELFETLVLPILLYGSEIWGLESNSQDVEMFQCRYYKRLLHVSKFTANCMTYGEVGKHSIKKLIESRMLNFWIRIIVSKTSKLSHTVYDILKIMFDLEIYRNPWLVKIKNTLDKLGLSYLWFDNQSINPRWFKATIKTRLDDVYSQNWHAEMFSNSLCLNYRIFKENCSCELSLLKLPFKYRITLTKFRCGNHRLPIASGRFANIERSQRICTICDTAKLGDEFHYLFECPAFLKARNKYIDVSYTTRPNALKMYKLFNSSKMSILINLSKFCSIIMHRFNK